MIVKSPAQVKSITLITSTETVQFSSDGLSTSLSAAQNEQAKHIQIEQLNEFKDHLSKRHSIDLTVQYLSGLHDREMRYIDE